MLRNFLRTATRNIVKYKAYSFINFTGLTCGIALSLLILSYIRYELSYDQFQQHADRLYRLNYTAPNGLRLATTPPPIAPLMPGYFPDVEQAARVYARNVSITHAVPLQGESFEETDVLFADSSLTKMFSFTALEGDPANALREPYTLILTQEMAKKYFGNGPAIGETLLLGGNHAFRVGAIVEAYPENSHLRFHMIASWQNMFDLENDAARTLMTKNLAVNFVISHCATYVLLKPGSNPHNTEASMPAFLKKYCPPKLQVGQVFDLMAVTDIHLKSTFLNEPGPVTAVSTLLIFGAIGVLTLLIACINFINLSTAQSFTRIKEIGIRKILGSGRTELVVQFLAESFLFCFVSTVLAYGVFYLTLPLLALLTGAMLKFRDVMDLVMVACSVVLLLVVTLLAGGYPAWFVASFQSVSSLKGESGSGSGSSLLRRSLVVFQLMIACVLLSGSMMLVKQLDYINERPLGFQKDHVITIPLFSQNLNAIFSGADSTFRWRIQTFRDKAEMESNVVSTSMSSASPGLGTIYRGAIPEGFTQNDNLYIADLGVDFDFIANYGVAVKAGRSFDRKHGTDAKEGFMVNETAVREFHWGTPEQALGKTIIREGKKGKVIGVVADFNMQSMTSPIGSLIIEIDPDQWSAVSVKIRNTGVPETLRKLGKEWVTLFPEKTFEFKFLDEEINQQYSSFISFGKVIEIFTAIAVLISCLGVYGLVLFIVRKKVKEIGVRKVLGASLISILQLIFREFAILIFAGFIFAVPVSWYFISQWLQNFQFHTTIDPLTYVIALITIVIVVALTVSYHALKASLINPVNSLRSE